MHWYVVALQKYAVFSGRSRRSEYWYFQLFNFLLPVCGAIALGLLLVFAAVKSDTAVTIAMWVYDLWALATLLPGLAVSVRRLHDTGRSGWWIFIGAIPLIGFIIFLVFMCEDSKPEDNQWGPSPKQMVGAVPVGA